MHNVQYTACDRQQSTAKAGSSTSLASSDLVESDGDYTVPSQCEASSYDDDDDSAFKVTVIITVNVILVAAALLG